MLGKVILVLFFILANGFFVAAEFALVKMRLNEIEILARTGKKTAIMAESIVQHLDTYLSACQLGITLASLALGWIGEPLVARMLEPVVTMLGIPADVNHLIAFSLAFVVITFLHITVGEQVPKILATEKYKPTALFVSPPLVVFVKIFRPFIWLLNTSSNAMLRAIGIRLDSKHGEIPTEDEVRHMLFRSAAGGYVTPNERVIMENVLDLEEKIARRSMLPRNQIVYLNVNDPIDEQLRRASESGHTRLPLCDGDMEHIIGIVHVKDIFQAMAAKKELTTLVDIAREVIYLPDIIHLDTLLVEFQKRKALIAMLVNEFGIVSGMITLENVLEELVGPIQDEFDDERPQIIKKGPHQYEVDALCSIGEVSLKCKVQLPADVIADTIGGVVIDSLGRIPQVGEKLMLGKHEITIQEAEQTKIKRILVERKVLRNGKVQEQEYVANPQSDLP